MVAGEYDSQRGFHKYPSTPSEAPSVDIPTEEMIQKWFSRDPTYQNDLPEQPPYDQVIGDNQLVNAIAYQMIHNGRRFVRKKPGQIWGSFDSQEVSGLAVGGGATEDLTVITGWGWITNVYFMVDNPELALNVFVDGEQLTYAEAYPNNLWKGWQHGNPGYPGVVSVYNTHDDVYTVELHPDPPTYFDAKVECQVTDTGALGGTVNVFELETRLNSE